jgi:hypothetical protein
LKRRITLSTAAVIPGEVDFGLANVTGGLPATASSSGVRPRGQGRQ